MPPEWYTMCLNRFTFLLLNETFTGDRGFLLFSIFLLLLNTHQHQEQIWAGWFFTFRICTLTSRLCFMSKKKKCLSFSLPLHQMLGFGRKKLDLENFSHFSLNSFRFIHFVLFILFYLHKKN